MSQTIYSLAGFSGGLESDIRDVYKDAEVVFFNVSRDYSKTLLRLYLILIQLSKINKNNPILSAGGPIELMAALIYSIFFSCIVYTPGTPIKYYKYISLLMLLSSSDVVIRTCDIGFKKYFPNVELYNNNPFLRANDYFFRRFDNPITKKFDAILIGRCDENKRFQNFIDQLSVVCDERKVELSIAHIGDGFLFSKSNNLNINSLGFKTEIAEVLFHISNSKLLCISSIYESSPRVFWEATFIGVPVISTCCGNLAHFPSIRCCKNLIELSHRLFSLCSKSNDYLDLIAKNQYDEANKIICEVINN